jgi:hypothetical protein
MCGQPKRVDERAASGDDRGDISAIFAAGVHVVWRAGGASGVLSRGFVALVVGGVRPWVVVLGAAIAGGVGRAL